MQKIKLLLLLCLCSAVLPTFADEQIVATTDKITISQLEVEPGSSDVYSFTVSLQGSSVYYTAYDILLDLPEGLDVALTNKGAYRVSMVKPSLYPYTEEEEEDEEGEIIEVKTYSHSLSCNFISARTLRVITYSNHNENFTKTYGNLFKVYVKAGPYLKPGDAPIKVHTAVLTENRGGTTISHCPADYVSNSVQASSSSTLSLKVSAENQFGTCILPFDLDLPGDGSIEAYTSTEYSAGALILTKAERIEAYTPYILYAPQGYDATVSGNVDASKYPANGIVTAGNLVGTVVTTEAASGSYVMQNQGNGPMFYLVGDSPFSIAPGKCYATLPGGAASVAMRFDDDATSISDVQSDAASASEYYNIMGQRILRPVPGQIYIQGGVKRVAR